MKKVEVIKSDQPETTEILAEAIIRIGSSIDELNKNGINKKGILILLRHNLNMPMYKIETVLDALPELVKLYCVKK